MSKDISRAAPALGYSPSESGCVALPSLRQKKFFLHTKADSIKKILKNQRGEANYFSAVIFIFITVLLLAFIIDLFGIISTKQQLDHCADQMVKQIQLSGGDGSALPFPLRADQRCRQHHLLHQRLLQIPHPWRNEPRHPAGQSLLHHRHGGCKVGGLLEL